MAVLVQTGGKIKLTPPEYEQLINYTMLYDFGVENAELAGGWTIYSATVTKNANNISIGSNGVLHTANAIPFTQYKKMYAVGVASADNHAYVCCMANNNSTPLFTPFGTTKGLVGVDLTTALDTYKASLNADNGYSATVYNVFLAKADDINTLCTKAGVTLTDLDTLLADTASLTAIFNSEDAVKYMVAQCTGDFMVGVLNSADAVSILKTSPYLNTVIGNPHWAKFIMMIPTAKELLGYTTLFNDGAFGDYTATYKYRAYGSSYYSGAVYSADENGIYLYSKQTGENGYQIDQAIDFSEYSLMSIKLKAYESTKNDVEIDLGIHSLITSGYGTSTCYFYTYAGDTNYCSYKASELGVGNFALWDISTINDILYATVGKRSGNTDVARSITVDNWYIFKPDDWTTWASLGGVIAPTSLDTLLADSVSMATLMANEEACKYLMGCTGDLMISICNSEVAMNALVNNIAYGYAFNHPVWYKFMTMIPTSLSAMDSVAVTVPTMTGYTTPSGEVIYDSNYVTTGCFAWKVFDKLESGVGRWDSASGTGNHYVGYKFGEDICVYKVRLLNYYEGSTLYGTKVCKIQGSDNGADWVDVTGEITVGQDNDIIIDTPESYRYYRMLSISSYRSDGMIEIFELQFYGKAVTK